jgi:hypothetical protein
VRVYTIPYFVILVMARQRQMKNEKFERVAVFMSRNGFATCPNMP